MIVSWIFCASSPLTGLISTQPAVLAADEHDEQNMYDISQEELFRNNYDMI